MSILLLPLLTRLIWGTEVHRYYLGIFNYSLKGARGVCQQEECLKERSLPCGVMVLSLNHVPPIACDLLAHWGYLWVPELSAKDTLCSSFASGGIALSCSSQQPVASCPPSPRIVAVWTKDRTHYLASFTVTDSIPSWNRIWTAHTRCVSHWMIHFSVGSSALLPRALYQDKTNLVGFPSVCNWLTLVSPQQLSSS